MVSATLLAALLVAGPPSEQPAIAWEVPLACPSEGWLTARIEAYLGRPWTPDERDEAFARGFGARIQTGTGGRFELELRLGATRHELGDDDCQRLADLAASLVAIRIDPLALGPPVVPLTEAEPPILVPTGPVTRHAEPASASADTTSPSEPQRPRPEPPEPIWELVPAAEPRSTDDPRARPLGAPLAGLALAEVGFGVGLFPSIAPQVHAGLGLERRFADRRTGLRVELGAGATLGGQFRAAGARELGGDLLAWDVVARPCAVPRWGRVDLRGCASVGAGQLRGRGVGVQNSQTVAQPWVWAAAELGLAIALRRADANPRVGAALFIDAGGGVNVVRPQFVVLDANGGSDVGYVVPPAFVRGRLGIELRFF